MVLVFCAATAGSVLYPPPPPGTPAARASCPEQADANAPDEAPSAPSGSFAENHDETAKHLVPFDLTHPQACRLADLADPGAAPLGSRLPPPPPPPPNPAA
jgi:hypothetical protein